MTPDIADTRLGVIRRVADGRPGLELLVLFGSRARGDTTARSDWDLGYLADEAFDAQALLADLAVSLATDRVDLVDLARAGAQLRFRAARDGVPVHAADAEAFRRFWLEAVSFWCEAGPTIRAGYGEVLADLER